MRDAISRFRVIEAVSGRNRVQEEVIICISIIRLNQVVINIAYR